MSRRIKELSGMTFGKLTAIKRQGSNKHGDVLWLCKCECGNEKIVPSRYLLEGSTKSCGCYTFQYPGIGGWKKGDRKGKVNPNYKHGKAHHRLYTVYQGMKQRCHNKKTHEFHRYGGRGITVCDEWLNNFEAFYEWAMANGYKEGLCIDRIDNDGNYEPSNCQWITRSENTMKISLDKQKKNTI